ncbi:MAG: DNA cytosine methyltransferase [Fusobacteria bacterium]|nr:DNA cytosine methyltransferase [Fusobacteriota bacterium]
MGKINTYISLFSSAGVGCYGFKQENFECIATNEIISRRIEIQKHNNKCKYDSGYICGDITSEVIKSKLFNEIEFWKKNHSLKRVDVIVATPPCQGMSVANHKKAADEIVRNSLVVESIKLIKIIKPKFFIFENVSAFMKSVCTDMDGKDKKIREAIDCNLGSLYSYHSQIINFKNYGGCSSRQRTIVIGVSKDLADDISPFELYPDFVNELSLREVIGKCKKMKKFGEIDEDDIFHFFRPYPEHMRNWICDLKEGQSAFQNEEEKNKPHQIINDKIVLNQQKNGDKYRRQLWDKVGPCIHTRNDQLASQNTIHPQDDRVFSIRELMLMMTIPDEFKWVQEDITGINSLDHDNKLKFLKKNEINIRQSIGEAVPTKIFRIIAKKIKEHLNYTFMSNSAIKKLVLENDFSDVNVLTKYIKNNPKNLSISTLGRVAELSNTFRTDNAAFFTNKSLITEILKEIPDSNKDEIRILEPSVGVGNFVPLIFKKFENKKVKLDLLDIDDKSILVLKTILEVIGIPKNFEVNFITSDFLLYEFVEKYDYIIGNPPFNKLSSNHQYLSIYRQNAMNKESRNICSFFLDKAINYSRYVAFVFPKFILSTPEFKSSREYLSNKAIECIIDFGEKGFQGVLVETIALFVNTLVSAKNTKVISFVNDFTEVKKQSYICDNKFPYWLIYRNKDFDLVCEKLNFGEFNVFRDRQITNAVLKKNGDIRVIKSRNINDTGTEILNIDSYDTYIDYTDVKNFSVYQFFQKDDVYLTPNMTYNPRVIKKTKNILVNGSVAILIPKNNIELTENQLAYFSTPEYRHFYKIARNYQIRSLNIDSCSVYFFGVLKDFN